MTLAGRYLKNFYINDVHKVAKEIIEVGLKKERWLKDLKYQRKWRKNKAMTDSILSELGETWEEMTGEEKFTSK